MENRDKLTVKKWEILCDNYGIFHHGISKEKRRIWMWMEDESDLKLVRNLLEDYSDVNDLHHVDGNQWVLTIAK